MAKTRSQRLDAIEAFAVSARAQINGMNAEMDAGGGRKILKRVHALRAETETQLRRLEEIAGEIPPE